MKNKGLFQRLVLGLVLAVGFLTVWLLVGMVVLESGVVFAVNRAGANLTFRADGAVVIAHSESDGSTQYRDLNGAALTIPEEDAVGWLYGTQMSIPKPWQEEDGEWDHRIRFFSDGRSPHTAWYFVADGQPEGNAYFVGYDSQTKAKIGYLGRAGFRAELPSPEERFPFAGSTGQYSGRVFCPDQDNRRPQRVTAKHGVFSIEPETEPPTPGIVYLLGRDQTLYEANLRKHTVRALVHANELHSMQAIHQPSDAAHGFWSLAVRTDCDIFLLNRRGEMQRRYPIPAELRELPLSFGVTSTGEALMFWVTNRETFTTQVEYRLFWVHPDGQCRTASVTLPYASPMRGLRVWAFSLAPAPLALDAFLGIERTGELLDNDLERTPAAALVRALTEFWPAIALAQLLAAVLALLCYRRQVRYGLGRGERIAWPLFVLLMGLPGWIGYRFGRKWPVLESCLDCGVAVPHDREDCVRCTQAFPTPALKGTEVFA